MISAAELAARVRGERFPLLTLEEFFAGNPHEDSLAPLAWGSGRPPLAVLQRRLAEAERAPDIAWIRVEADADSELDRPDGVVRAESIVLATTAPAAELERRLDTAALGSLGIAESDESALEDLCEVPPLHGHERIVFLVWD
ncbi:hypothetical protein [Leucobacter sp. M11]|uniref:hypothetical protein n=1 Tax=Leucobacter sp. M11 TaxID=2993565 RepID=UPI002D8017EA|nr:hypothetical protein [Leucobacter sp. M11]MEB4613262.1 hypothetical protein [Leucobacter sp. M11]